MAITFKSTLRQRKYNYLTKKGFSAQEATQLSRTSRSGMRAPYFRFMLRSRERTLENAKRYGWSQREFHDYILQQYRDLGISPRDPFKIWKLLRHFEERAYRRGEEYDSPWRKRIRRSTGKKREMKRTTRVEMLKSWISEIDRTMSRTTNEYRLERLRTQKENLQKELDRMK